MKGSQQWEGREALGSGLPAHTSPDPSNRSHPSPHGETLVTLTTSARLTPMSDVPHPLPNIYRAEIKVS